MWMSLLFNDHDELLAAAPACDHQPYGDRYWRQLYPHPLPHSLGHTAVVEVKDRDLLRSLLDLPNYPESLEICRQLLERREVRRAA